MAVFGKLGRNAAIAGLLYLTLSCGKTHSNSQTGSCAPICSLPNARASCGPSCAIERCNGGFADCNGISTDGCERNIASDPTSCGACDSACAQSACTQGICGTTGAQTVWATEPDPSVSVPDDPFIQRMALDATSVYWVSPMRAQVAKAPLAGGAATILATAQTGALRVAVDSDYVYWISADGDPAGSARISAFVRRVPKLGGAPEQLATIHYDGSFQDDLVVDGGYVYWLSAEDNGPLAIARVPSAGGSVEQVRPSGDGALYTFAISGDLLYVLLARTVAGVQTFSLEVQPKAGGAATVVNQAFDAGPLSRLAAGDSIYLTSASPVQIWEIAPNGEWIRAIPDSRGALDLTFDAASLYARNDRTLWVTDRVSMTKRVLGGRGSSAFEGRLLVDDKYLYYATSAGIQRIPKE